MATGSLLKRGFVGGLLIALLGIIVGAVAHRVWSQGKLEELAAGSHVALTARGPIEYALVGERGAPVVLALHGTPGGYDQLLEDAPYLTRHGLRLLTVSRPGYLRTPLTRNERFSEQSALVAALLDSLTLDQVFVIAGSGGGPMAIVFAAEQPERCRGLVLVSAVSKKIEFTDLWWTSDLVHAIFFTGPVYDGLNLMVRANPAAMLPDERTHGETGEHGLPAEKLARLQRVIDTTLPLAGRNAGMQNDFRQFSALARLPLEKVRAPTLLIHGAKDETVPPEHAEQAKARIPNATLHLYENGSHLLFVEQVEAVQDEAAQFMLGLAATPGRQNGPTAADGAAETGRASDGEADGAAETGRASDGEADGAAETGRASDGEADGAAETGRASDDRADGVGDVDGTPE